MAFTILSEIGMLVRKDQVETSFPEGAEGASPNTVNIDVKIEQL